MIRPKLSLRRPLAVVGAAIVGITAAVAVAAPASAHHPTVYGTAECDTATGNWAVNWTVTNSEADLDGTISKVDLTPAGTEVSTITVGARLPKSVDGNLTGKQLVPGASGATGAQLTVEGTWIRDHTIIASATGSVSFEGTCQEPTSKPAATFASQCDGTVVVTLVNAKEATKDATFVVTGKDGFTQTKVVAAGKDDTITVPAKNAGSIVVTEKGKDQPVATGKWTEPKGCTKPSEPKGTLEFTCTEMIFTIENPKDGKTVTITFTPNKGEAQTLVVAPGETKSAKFAASEGLTVTPKAEGLDDTGPIAWEKPADCTTPVPGGGAGGPTLPKTGAPAGLIAGGAAALLAIGAGLFFMARRRRIRFTA